ncbi:MAG TPA: ABC transporter permease [Blastocatellia bacterium]|nr:ABC transporter permease [Blastocatellia bacterium]
MRTLWQDLRFALRILAKSPGFTAVVVLSLALGIGANTTIFSLINAALFKPLPRVKEPDRLVWFRAPASYPDYEDFRDQNDVFSGISSLSGTREISLSRDGQPELVKGEFVSANYFSVLGVDVSTGRAFLPEEDRIADAQPVVVLSHGLWRRRFGGDPNLIGGSVNLNGLSFTVIGVAPPGFVGAEVHIPRDLWAPMAIYPRLPPAGKGATDPNPLRNRGMYWLNLVARLKPGVTRVQAQAAMTAIVARLPQERYDQTIDERLRAVELLTVSGGLDPRDRAGALPISGLLQAIVSLVLLTACANIAGLLLARSSLRRREIGIRQALGASRARIIQQLLTESLLLSLLGALAGLLVAAWARDLLISLSGATPIAALDLSLDYRVLSFTFSASLLAGLTFGLAPALQASKPDLIPALKNEAAGKGYRRSRLRNAFVVSQTALSVVLLIGSGLFIRSLQNAQTIDPGFKVEGALIATLDPGLLRYGEEQGQEFFRQAVERVGALPGVESASLMDFVPLGLRFAQHDVFVEGRNGSRAVSTGFNTVGPRYFQTMGIPVRRGREFTTQDRTGALPVVMLNETLARRLWPGEDPIGKRLRLGGPSDPEAEVIGVARDGKYATLGENARPYIYRPLLQSYASRMTLVVRTTGNPETLSAAVREQIHSLDPNLPVAQIKTLAERVEFALFPARLGAALLGAFGLLALGLAATGVYGVIAYSVSQRAQEFGIRMALGADGADVRRLVLREGLKVALIGVTVGLALSLAATRLTTGFLYGVGANDPLTFVGVALLLTAVALLACYLPARRATKVDPMVALRCE